jgi:hypothetical protein
VPGAHTTSKRVSAYLGAENSAILAKGPGTSIPASNEKPDQRDTQLRPAIRGIFLFHIGRRIAKLLRTFCIALHVPPTVLDRAPHARCTFE